MASEAVVRLMASPEFRSDLIQISPHIFYETLSQLKRGGVSSSVLLA
jgi:hypothetical protein